MSSDRSEAPDQPISRQIGIVGLGYVGSTSAACLADDGHRIWGIDINPQKLEAFGHGSSPVVEPGIADLIQTAFERGQLHTAHVIDETLIETLDLVMVCVGTPRRADGQLDLTPLLESLRAIAGKLEHRSNSKDPLLIVIRSTLQPGSLANLIVPTMAAAAKNASDRYEIVYNPEFLREASAIQDYRNPAKIVLGERVPGAGRRLLGIYDRINAAYFETSYANAEMVKLADNAFHATKVTFGNEIGRLCLANDADAQKVMDMLLSDTRLNISAAYLRPGGPYGGSCLPKDVSSLSSYSEIHEIPIPLINSLNSSNRAHLDHLTRRVLAVSQPGDKVLLVGVSFKTGTDDLRESPLILLAENLVSAGIDLQIFDPDVRWERMLGENYALAAEHRRILDLKIDRPEDAVLGVSVAIIGKRIEGMNTHLASVPKVLDFDRLS